MKLIHAQEANSLLKQGKIIAYPTEAVFGLGCDPFNQQAVERLLAIKHRSVSKGLILLIAHWVQLTDLTAPVPDACLQKVKASWPGPVTWVFPKAYSVPNWLSGGRDTIAVRMSAHPIAHELCLSSPIVSTSANLSSQEPARDALELQHQFPQGIDACVMGELGGAVQPSKIFDALTGEQLR